MKPGTKVRIKGLARAAHYNGKVGIVTEDTAPGEARVGVKLSGGTALAVKAVNLEVLLSANTDKKTASKSSSDTMPNQRTLKREMALLREFDGSPDPNTLALYYHFADRAFDAYNATEYNGQMTRYYNNDYSVRVILPRKIGSNNFFFVGLQHTQQEKNVLCELAFNCGRSFLGIGILVKKRCFKCSKPGVVQCEQCLCACFCSDVCQNSDIGREHQRLCKKIKLSTIMVEDDCVQLLE